MKFEEPVEIKIEEPADEIMQLPEPQIVIPEPQPVLPVPQPIVHEPKPKK
jgi:hypothetical protein